jgi:hypothetical protein
MVVLIPLLSLSRLIHVLYVQALYEWRYNSVIDPCTNLFKSDLSFSGLIIFLQEGLTTDEQFLLTMWMVLTSSSQSVHV